MKPTICQCITGTSSNRAMLQNHQKWLLIQKLTWRFVWIQWNRNGDSIIFIEFLQKAEEKDTLWSLVLTNPDGHHNDSEQEYVHWFMYYSISIQIQNFVQLITDFSSNIPNGDLSKGETIVPYIQPFPVKGTGYHRHIFVLYKQEKKLDFSKYKVNKL